MGTGELLGKPNKFQRVTCNGLAGCPGGVEILLAASYYRKCDKLLPDEPVLAPRLHSLTLASIDGKTNCFDSFQGQPMRRRSVRLSGGCRF